MNKITTKAKSAIYHLETALAGLEKAQIHLLQARTALPKGDVIGRGAVMNAGDTLVNFQQATAIAIRVITEANPAQVKEE